MVEEELEGGADAEPEAGAREMGDGDFDGGAGGGEEDAAVLGQGLAVAGGVGGVVGCVAVGLQEEDGAVVVEGYAGDVGVDVGCAVRGVEELNCESCCCSTGIQLLGFDSALDIRSVEDVVCLLDLNNIIKGRHFETELYLKCIQSKNFNHYTHGPQVSFCTPRALTHKKYTFK